MNGHSQKNVSTSFAHAFISRSGSISPTVLRLGSGDSGILTINELEAAVVTDPEFSLRALALANSAFYSQQHEISSLRGALVVLGVSTVHKLAASLLSKSLHSSPDAGDEALWQHCQAVGVAAEMLCEVHQQVDPHQAFAAGLLHDIGILALQVLEQEDSELFADHAIVGAEIAYLLGLSPALSSAIAHHDEHQNSDCEDTALETTIYIANEIAARCGFANDRENYGDEKRMQTAVASLAMLESDIDVLATGLPTRMQIHQATLNGTNT
jgi:putative nucleotidyltransferase with HDIG domain